MKVRELIDNREFNFNPKFRLVWYDYDNDKEVTIGTDEDDLRDYYEDEITAVNQDDDGTVIIECTQLVCGVME